MTRTVSHERDTFTLDLSVKLAVAIGKNRGFEIYVGWIPSIILYEKRRSALDSNSDGSIAEDDETEKEESSTIEWGRFRIQAREGVGQRYALGFSVRPYKVLTLHFNFIPDDEFINLGRANIGVDYKF